MDGAAAGEQAPGTGGPNVPGAGAGAAGGSPGPALGGEGAASAGAWATGAAWAVGPLEELEELALDDGDGVDAAMLQQARAQEQAQDSRTLALLAAARGAGGMAAAAWRFLLAAVLAAAAPRLLLPAAAAAAALAAAQALLAAQCARLARTYARPGLAAWAAAARAAALAAGLALLWAAAGAWAAGGGGRVAGAALLAALLLCCCAAAAAELLLRVAVEEEWLAAMFALHGLAPAQARLRTCGHAGAALAPALLAAPLLLPPAAAVPLAGLLLAPLLAAEAALLAAALARRPDLRGRAEEDSRYAPADLFAARPLAAAVGGLRAFRRHPLFAAALGHGLLAAWAGHAPAMALVAYLAAAGLPLPLVAAFRVLCGGLCLAAAACRPLLVRKAGALLTARGLLCLAAILALVTVPVFHFGGSVAFMASVALAEAFLFAYQAPPLGGALIRMEDVRLAQFDASLQVLASVGINLLACAVFFHSLYFVVVWASAVAVLGGAVLLVAWSYSKAAATAHPSYGAVSMDEDSAGEDFDDTFELEDL